MSGEYSSGASEKLFEEIEELPRVPAESVEAYKQKMGELVARVNVLMSSREDIGNLIGKNPLSLAFENHRNHAIFMASVMSLNEFVLMLETLVWAYRSYRSRGFSYDYFPAHLSAWQKALKELIEPRLSDPVVRIYSWMESKHDALIGYSMHSSNGMPAPSPKWKATYNAFLRALLRGDSESAMELARQSKSTNTLFKQFCVHVVQPSLYAVGKMWEKNEISVGSEHLASAIVNRMMSVSYIEFMKESEIKRGKAVVSAAMNQYHEIGATMVANALEADGWEVCYLGANMPADELLGFVYAGRYDILALSVTMPFNLDAVRDLIGRLKGWPHERQPRVMLGGLVFRDFPELPEKLGADGFAEDCMVAVEMARKWHEAGL